MNSERSMRFGKDLAMNTTSDLNRHRERPNAAMPLKQPGSNSATTVNLLGRIGTPNDQQAWIDFDARYRPVVLAVARRLGLRQCDAEDVAQQTMIAFLREWTEGRFDPTRARLRTWILAIVRHRAIDCLRARQRMLGSSSESIAEQVPVHEMHRTWDEATRRAILDEALDHLRREGRTEAKTIDAFERFALHAVPPEAVAEEFGIEVAEVYRIKSRIVKKLREVVATLEANWTDAPQRATA